MKPNIWTGYCGDCERPITATLTGAIALTAKCLLCGNEVTLSSLNGQQPNLPEGKKKKDKDAKGK